MNKILYTLNNKSVITLIVTIYAISLLLLQIGHYGKIFSRPFRKDFFYTLYYNSQWVNPESNYGIGDDGLYQVGGLELATKHKFFTIAPEVPPLGQYLYGYSIQYFGNAEKTSLILFLLSIVLFMLISRQIIKDKVIQAFAILLLITEPLLFYQSSVSMLDLPQLTALMVHILALFWFVKSGYKSTNIKYAIVFAGFGLGAFISIKIAFFAIAIILADLVVLMIKKKPLIFIVPMYATSLLTYFASYSMYFIQGNSLSDFIRAQKWMIHFHLSSSIEPLLGTVYPTLLIGRIIGWGEGSVWTNVPEWTSAWTIYSVSLLILIAVYFKNKKLPSYQLTYLIVLVASLIGIYSVIPFFTRYLTLVIPILIILHAKLIEILPIRPKYKYTLIAVTFIMQYYMFWNIL